MTQYIQNIIAVDPGGRSGYATATMSLDRIELGESGVLPQKTMGLWLAEQQHIRGVGHHVEAWRNAPRFDVIVCESWRPFRRNGSLDWIEGSPLIYAQHVGQIRLIVQLSGAKYVEQQPSDKKHFLKSYPEYLRKIDERSDEQHDQDARYHLWGYFFSQWMSGEVDPEDVFV